jgi:perosamine synthetase
MSRVLEHPERRDPVETFGAEPTGLAIHGGSGVVDVSLHRRWPEITEADRRAVLAVLDRGVLSGPTAPEVSGLERDFAAYLGVEYCLALNSGTAALHCCCAAAGLGPGDEVIVPALTFIASAMAVCQQGATPVFCDIDPTTYNIDPGLIEERITEHTKAIMAVHLHGLPCDMDPIQRIAERHGLLVIEDAAQAPGATYKGQKVGSLGHTAGFSLQQTKNLCGGDGGLFVTNDEQAYKTAARLRLFGEDVPWQDHHGRVYWSHSLGFNYRNHELSAALARSQLRRLDHYNHTAQTNARLLTESLSDVPGLQTPQVPDDRTCVFYLYRLRLRSEKLGFTGPPAGLRDRAIQALKAEGVEARLWQHWTLSAHPIFRREGLESWQVQEGQVVDWDPLEFQQATNLLEESVCVGSERAPLMVQDEHLMNQYAEAIKKVIRHIDQLAMLPLSPHEVPA